MPTTVVIGLALIVTLLIGFILLGFLLNKRAKRSAVLVATVDIYLSGKSHVDFIPHSNLEDMKLMKLALLYAAKIRYTQSDENPQIVEVYESLMEEVMTPSGLSENDDLSKAFRCCGDGSNSG